MTGSFIFIYFFNLGGESGEAGFTFLQAFIILLRLEGELGDRDSLL
jgi:hypothetical protein